jgi:hypothetical protein
VFDNSGNLFLLGNLFVNGLVPVSQGGTASPLPALSAAGQLTLSGTAPNGLLFLANATATVGNPGDLTLQEATATAGAIGVFVNGDTNARFTINASGLIKWGPGNAAQDTNLQRSGVGVLALSAGSFDVSTAGQGLRVAEGANAKQGTAILVAGSAVVANTSVTATSRIFLTSQVDGGAPGFLRVSTRTAGTSFTITSSSGTDTSTVAYQIFEVG